MTFFLQIIKEEETEDTQNSFHIYFPSGQTQVISIFLKKYIFRIYGKPSLTGFDRGVGLRHDFVHR